MPNIFIKNVAGSTCTENYKLFDINSNNHYKYKYITSFNNTKPVYNLFIGDIIIEIIPKSLIKRFKKFQHAYINKSRVTKIYRNVIINNLDFKLKDESPEFRSVIKNELERDGGINSTGGPRTIHIIMVEWIYFDDMYTCKRKRIQGDPCPRSWGQILLPDNKVYNEIMKITE